MFKKQVSKSIIRALSEIEVIDCEYTKKRIGNNSDGGYIVLDEVCQQTDYLISIGVEDNVTFDLDLVETYSSINVDLYDHTVEDLPVNHENFNFYKKGIAVNKTKDFETLDNIIEKYNNKTMLKMDIEWDEWSVLDNIKRATLQNFNQLLIELHLVHIDTNNNFMLSNEKLTPYFKNFYLDAYHGMNEYIFDLYYKVLHKLRRDFHIFHISANNSLQKVDFADCTFPPLIELSLVRKDIVNNAKSTKCKFPVDGLDYPNKPWRDEIIDFYPVA